MKHQRIRVLCVDDNRMLAEALATQIAVHPDLQWVGWVENSPNLAQDIRDASPDVVLMDIDMPGPDPFVTVSTLAIDSPGIRVLMFSAYVRKDYIDRAIEMGAWGYISKNECIADVLDALRRAYAGEFIMTPDVLAEQRVIQ